MIKANELRIGNLVLDSTKNVHIIERLDEKWDFSDRYPIPLTEEWLKKLGFEFYVPLCHYKLCNNDIWVSVTKELVFSFCNLNYDERVEMPPKIVRYVHQLQNLYFAITGEELVFSSTEP